MRKAGTAIWRSSQRTLASAAAPPPVQITTLPNKIRVALRTLPAISPLSVSTSMLAHAMRNHIHPAYPISRQDGFQEHIYTDRRANGLRHPLPGGQIMCSSSRESMMYQSSHAHKGTPLALSLIADTVLNPAFKPEELEAQRDAAAYEIREISTKPEMILPEVLHNVAYGNQGLGNPLLLAEWYRPERMVIAGAGMPHQELVELTDRFFASLKASESTLSSSTTTPLSQQLQQAHQSRLTNASSANPQAPPHILNPTAPGVAKSLTRAASYLMPKALQQRASPGPVPKSPTSTYTGGHRFIYDPTQELGHLYVAFEGVGINDDDVYALAVMQVLLGGGGSFSAGGPGKGMYSRLYTHILNHYTQIDHCASFHHIYNDSSLFGLFASFLPAASGRAGGNTPAQILPHLVHQLSLLVYSPVPEAELGRARNQLNSSLMMALESRAVEVEDLGRQILVHNRKVPVGEMTDKINAVTAADIRRVAARVFSPDSGSKATVVCMGAEDVGGAWPEVFAKYGVRVLRVCLEFLVWSGAGYVLIYGG
ncbi:Metalloenzyme, LuxS/M16 peptidase-like protein [Flammula alnicola]|nr:Metalloenzyme, LuxS/M16 peptidase-like protein [Flammula alnicola]